MTGRLKTLLCLLFLFFNFLNASAQCTNLDIVASKTDACAPEVIMYYVTNAPDGSLFEWEIAGNKFFGGDTIYQSHIDPASFMPKATISMLDGTICHITGKEQITIHGSPVPLFSVQPTLLCDGPGKSQLTDITPNTQARNWIVDGDNYSNTPVTIEHDFFTLGKKTISLIVTNIFGCKGVKTFIDTIEVLPKLDFDFDADVKNGCITKSVNFSVTKDPSSIYAKKYYWDFPGATNERDSGLNPPSRIYDKIGSYDVTLTVELSNGCKYTKEKKDYLKFGDVVNLELTTSKKSSCLKTDIELTQTEPNLPGNLTWSYAGVPVNVLSSSGSKQTIQGTSSGDLTITIRHDHHGCISKEEFKDFIELKGVKANFSSPNRFHCEVPHIVDLKNSSDPMDANSLTYEWIIIDENGKSVKTSSLENPSFTFTTIPATYDAKLIVRGDNGCIDSITRKGYIWQDSLNLKFDAAPKIGCVGQEIKFRNPTKPSSWMSADEFKWYFYDLNNVKIRDSSFLRTPTHIYDKVGFYDVWLTGWNGIGCKDTLLKTEEVEIINPIVDFEVENPIVCVGEAMKLIGKTGPKRANFSHKWTFVNKSNSALKYSFSGETVNAKVPKAGEYWLYYEPSIAGGCKGIDSIEVYVNGISFKINLDKKSGCDPALIKPSVNLIDDFYEGQPSASYKYQWYIRTATNTSINDASLANPECSFDKAGKYFIYLTITNSAGCSHRTNSEEIVIGIKANNKIKKSSICYGDTFDVINTSTGDPSEVKFELEPNVPFELIEAGKDTFKLFCNVPGDYALRQMINKDNECFDTIIKPVKIIKTTVRFTTADSFLSCAPIYVEFKAEGENIDSLFWDFGNGSKKTTKDLDAGVIYNRNTLVKDGYDIELIAKSKEGCLDTMLKPDYIVVSGPIPDFKMYNIAGCEPLEVEVIDRSLNADRIYFNYNDGSTLDSTKVDSTIGLHKYNNVSNNLIQKIKPTLIVYDSLGCVASLQNDEITVYKMPQLNTQFPDDTAGCVDFNLLFSDEGKYSSSWKWSLNGNEISTQQRDSTIISDYTSHDLQLISSNTYCSDTINQAIFGLEKPTVNFQLTGQICNKVANFEGVVSTDNNLKINNYLWGFGENDATNNQSLTPEHHFTSRGTKDVKLSVFLENGCSDSISKNFEVLDDSDIDTSIINYVSFIDNYIVEIDYTASTYKKFKAYQIDRSDGNQIFVNSIENNNQRDTFTNLPNPECYSISVIDSCDAQGKVSDSHCFINLSVSSPAEFVNQLDWTHYVGWTSIDYYNIFKRVKNQSIDFELIAKVDGTLNTYRDTGLCNLDYEYYVQAVNLNGIYKSNSYRVENRPLFTTNPFISNVKNVTVSNEDEIKILWRKSKFNNNMGYELEKYQNDEGNFLYSIPINNNNDTSYTDIDVDVNSNSYIYTIYEVDNCLEKNQSDREGKSILLKGYSSDDGFHLNWTKYRQWETRVVKYDLLNFDIDNQQNKVLIGSTTFDKTTFHDSIRYKDYIGTQTCYQVYGMNAIGDTSYSNVLCIFGDPKISVPWAFTPNGDGLNDGFSPQTKYFNDGTIIGDYTFLIYNRWGEKIYETTLRSDSWDGTYQGEMCQQGVYVYKIKAKSLVGKIFNEKGTVTLLR